MSEEGWWGLILMIYIVPFWVWQISADETLRIRQRLFPGRTDVKLMGYNIDFIGLIWCAGLILLLLFWKVEIKPAPGLILAAIIVFFPYLIFRIALALRKVNFLRKLVVRLWLAISVTWCSAVFVYYLIFGTGSRLSGEEFILLATLPPIVLAIGKLSWHWAHNLKQ